MTAPTLWDEFDAMAFNLEEQAKAPGTTSLERMVYVSIAKRTREALDRFAGTAEGRANPEPDQTPRYKDGRPKAGPHAVRLNDLVDALQEAKRAVRRMGGPANPAMAAVDNFAHELIHALTAQPGEGPPGTPRVSPREFATTIPISASIPLGCTCAWIDITQGPDLPDRKFIQDHKDERCPKHGYRDPDLAEIGLCGWRHPRWREIRCTVRADQFHDAHAQHDVFGDFTWNHNTAVKGPGSRQDLPEWKGRP